MSKVRDVADSDSLSYMAANPVPMTMVAIGVAGLAWLATAGRPAQQSRPYARRDYSTPGRDWSTASKSALERESSAATTTTPPCRRPAARTRLRIRAGRSGYSAVWDGSKLTTIASGMGRGVPRRAPGQAYLQRAWRQNPLMLGVAAAVAGAVVGLGVPETERENELMGETRDRMLDSVQDTVRDKVDQVQQAATTALSSVQEAAKDVIGLETGQPKARNAPASGPEADERGACRALAESGGARHGSSAGAAAGDCPLPGRLAPWYSATLPFGPTFPELPHPADSSLEVTCEDASMAPTAQPRPARYVNIRCRTGRHERSRLVFLDDMVAVLGCPDCNTQWAVSARLPELQRLEQA